MQHLQGLISLRWAQYKHYHKHATPITWSEFKAFLRKDLGSFQAFIDSIWSKFRRDFQYQLEEARDWASDLQYLQSILSEFDHIRTTNELTLIYSFRESLKTSIKFEIEKQDRKSMNFEEMMQKAVNVEAKAGLRSSIMVRDSDGSCSRGHRPSYNTFSKMQTQGFKDSFHSKKPKPKDPKLAPPRDDVAKPAKKEDRKKKKKRFLNQRREHTGEQTPATGVNSEALKKKIKARCFNCNKNATMQMSKPNAQKTSVGLSNLYAGD